MKALSSPTSSSKDKHELEALERVGTCGELYFLMFDLGSSIRAYFQFHFAARDLFSAPSFLGLGYPDEPLLNLHGFMDQEICCLVQKLAEDELAKSARNFPTSYQT